MPMVPLFARRQAVTSPSAYSGAAAMAAVPAAGKPSFSGRLSAANGALSGGAAGGSPTGANGTHAAAPVVAHKGHVMQVR